MKKARANTNDYWDKKLLEVEEKDPNRWRHSGFKKMYIEGDSSSGSDHESYRYNRVNKNWLIVTWKRWIILCIYSCLSMKSQANRNRNSRSRSRNRKSPPSSPKRRSPSDLRQRSPQSPVQRGSRRTPEKRTHTDVRRRSPVTVMYHIPFILVCTEFCTISHCSHAMESRDDSMHCFVWKPFGDNMTTNKKKENGTMNEKKTNKKCL